MKIDRVGRCADDQQVKRDIIAHAMVRVKAPSGKSLDRLAIHRDMLPLVKLAPGQRVGRAQRFNGSSIGKQDELRREKEANDIWAKIVFRHMRHRALSRARRCAGFDALQLGLPIDTVSTANARFTVARVPALSSAPWPSTAAILLVSSLDQPLAISGDAFEPIVRHRFT